MAGPDNPQETTPTQLGASVGPEMIDLLIRQLETAKANLAIHPEDGGGQVCLLGYFDSGHYCPLLYAHKAEPEVAESS